ERELDVIVPPAMELLPMEGIEESGSRWNSPAKVLKILAARGLELAHTDVGTLQEHYGSDPLIPMLLEHREAAKRCGTYGRNFLRFVHPATGRIHADYFQL